MSLETLAQHVQASLAGAVLSTQVERGELSLSVQPESWLVVAQFLRDDPRCRFVNFVDLCGVDYPARAQRFDVVLHLLSPGTNLRVRVKAAVAEQQPIASLTGVFAGADWFEREAYDFYGLLFEGHPDLRRILTDYGFEGFPLRKDFPLTGHVEVRYDDELKRVVYQPVKLVQEFRDFDFLSPWEGAQYVLPNELKGDEKAEGKAS